MPCFYLHGKASGDEINLSDRSQLHHLRDVLRLKPGDEVTVFDEDGTESAGVISTLEKAQAVIRINTRKAAPKKRYKTAVACAIPKKTRFDDVIDKLTQLGVDIIIPLETRRTIVRVGNNCETRLERWRKIARSAAEQSQRNTLPLIYPVTGLKDVFALAGEYHLKLILALTGDRKLLKEVRVSPEFSSIISLIGPEGDFTPQEIEEAVKAGFIPVSLGDTVLRVETAAVAISAYLKLYLSA
jgi:16S rRNA (uracil1498-N3)-methyltransferase